MPKLNKSLKLTEFLDPRSKLTPGIATTFTVVISNSFSFFFEWDRLLTAIVISCVINLLVVQGQNIPLWKRIIYYILNTLYIFSMSLGANSMILNLFEKNL